LKKLYLGMTAKPKEIDLTYCRFGKLFVLSRSGFVGEYRAWYCICECGKTTVSTGNNLRGGGSTSCRCARAVSCRERRAPGDAGFNSLLARYRSSARKRGHVWKLSKQDFKSLTKQNCRYCGCSPSQTCYTSSKVTSETRAYGVYTYNGVDRLDNALGYEIDNCVACCKNCNFAKFTSSEDQFNSWLRSIRASQNP
jgi:hypothetical protein